ncbi:hypothetical protein NE237_018063 [Protea cynaroides]|uniref:Subtilisin-like protease fibronectin type-III domain-containing protein n=1 Tax=Protea cynaroides TaxID=273540 RepID=A0A9Q0K962_9MAGN|nr:hypothetical protein NE237_018063 [Protea cynaroides]
MELQNTDSNISAVFERTVTNVGFSKSVYKVNVKSPEGLDVTVIPDMLVFEQMNQMQSFTVVLKGAPIHSNPDEFKTISASLVWSDSFHIVRSPITVYYFPREY